MKAIVQNVPKKYITLIGLGFLLALSALSLTIWKTPDLSPSDTVESFDMHARNGNIEEAKELTSKEILNAFENGAFPHYGGFGGFLSDYQSRYKKVEPIPGTEKITGDSATVEAKIYYKTGREDKDTYHLIKEDGQWKIAQ